MYVFRNRASKYVRQKVINYKEKETNSPLELEALILFYQ